MVQKSGMRRRGRPRAYDPGVALERATDAFWDAGFCGTSLDDLSSRTGMNRPSLYAAFGDKQALYLKTLDGYCASRRALIAAALGSGRPLRDTLRAIYQRMLDLFLEGDRGARGCYIVGTAATEAVANPEVREMLAGSVRDMDEGFRGAFCAAQGVADDRSGSGTPPVQAPKGGLQNCRSAASRGRLIDVSLAIRAPLRTL